MIVYACNITTCLELPGHYRCVTHDTLLPTYKNTCSVHTALTNVQAEFALLSSRVFEMHRLLKSVDTALEVLSDGQHRQPDPHATEGDSSGKS